MTERLWYFGFDSFKVENCRSRGDHNDSDWLSVVVSAGRTVLPSQTKLIHNNLHAGDQVASVFVGPFVIPDGQLVSVTHTVTNLSHSNDQQSDSEQIALLVGGAVLGIVGGLEVTAGDLANVAKAEIEGAIIGAIGAVLATIGGVIGIHSSDPDCDGEILTRIRSFLPGELADSSDGPVTETVRSPSKCGNDPHTTVVYGIRRVPNFLRVSAVTSTPRGTQTFSLAEDGRVWSKFFDPQNPGPDNGWSISFPLNTNTFLTGAGITAVSSVPRGTQIFVLGLDRRVWTKFFDPQNPGPEGGWSAWFPLASGTFKPEGGIAAVSSTPRGTQVFCIGDDSRIWTKFFDPQNPGPEDGGWSVWFPLASGAFQPAGGIAAVSSTPRGTQVFALGLDNRVWTKFFDPQNLGPEGGWSVWFPLADGVFIPQGRVAAISSTPRGTQVFALGLDRRVWTKFFDPQNLGPEGGWSVWFPLGQQTFPASSRVRAVTSTPRGTQIFVVGGDGRVWTRFFDPEHLGPEDGGWSAWFPLGQNTFVQGADVAALSSTPRGTQVFTLGLDGRAWSKFFDPQNSGPEDGWSLWFPLG